MSAKQAAEFIRALAEANPSPRSELMYGNSFQLLVAVVLSAQATDKGVNIATRELFSKVKTPSQMVDLGVDNLRKHINSVGLYRNKSANIVRLSQILIDKHGGTVPDSRAQLEELPGVGRKTANVVLNCAFGQPTMAVDTHIFRVSNRTGLAPGKNPREVEDALVRRIPKQHLRNAHHWLILHGRYICVARTPKCGQCGARRVCNYPGKTACA